MPSTLRKSSITPRQREGRAINTVADLLRRTLRVPNIYLEPPSSVIAADVLAVDSGGAGDLHAVEVTMLEPWIAPKKWRRGSSDPDVSLLKTIHRQLMRMAAHYRYLAVSAEKVEFVREGLDDLGLFSEDGIGRIGLIGIKIPEPQSPTAEIAIAPERFRVDPTKLRTIETRILEKSRPDIEVRI
ncbi:MAG TPA: hypothetical protein VHX13_00570 [Acidobacteriaceae bacterium]|jgi:hypothetical protein|nr:hypothetical protein [Acidobacteriaceae bacterium]